MPAYRLPSPLARPPLQRRACSLALALGVNLGLLLVLLTLGRFADQAKIPGRAILVDLLPQSHSAPPAASAAEPKPVERKAAERPRRASPLKPPPVVLPSKPTIAAPPPAETVTKLLPWLEMSKAEMAAGDLRNLPQGGSGSDGDSEVVGTGPNGETLYAAEWARRPTDAELGGYLPRNAPNGYGLIACRTVAGNRVEDCIELDQQPRGSHLASAVRQAAWQFRVRPPRRNGRPLVGEWVMIRITYERIGGGGAGL